MKIDLNSSFPRHLELWIKGNILRYKAEEKELDSSKTEFLKSNKDFFRDIIERTGTNKIKVLPLAHNQKALWFLHKIDPENVSYNISFAVELKKPINIEALTGALTMLMQQHEMLRTIFTDLPGSENLACQIVLDKIRPAIEEVDGSNLSDEQIRNLLHDKSRLPFAFEQGPMFRVIVVRAHHSSILCLNFHHIICDAISLRNLLNEFILIYDSIVNKEPTKDNYLAADYSSYVFDQLDFLNSEEGDKQNTYWKNQIAGKPQMLNLPATFTRPTIHRFRGKTLLFRIEPERYKLLRSIAKKNSVTFNVFLLSLFEFFISKISGQKEFIVGLPAAGRTRKELENVFGYLINLLPLGCSISDEKSFLDFLNDNKVRVYESLENQDIPFPVIVENVSPKRDLSRTPLFQVIFNYLNKKALGSLLNFLGDNESATYSTWGNLLIKPYKIFDQEGQVDLTLEITDDDKNLICALKYNSDLFDEDAAKLFKEEFLQVADLIIKDSHFAPVWLSEKIISSPSKPTLNVNITGTFTVEPVKPYLEFWFEKIGVTPKISFPGYNQVFSQLLNPASEFNLNTDGYNILLIRLEDWIKDKKSNNNVKDFEKNIKEFDTSFSSAIKKNKTGKYIIAFCPSSPGILKNLTLSGRINKAEKGFLNSLKLISNVVTVSSDELIKTYDVIDYYEVLGEKIGHIPFTDEFFISLSTIIARKIQVSFISPFKAIAVDCDNTLWGGVVAEDGPLGIRIGHSEKALQEFLVDQMNSGILICLCSKNRKEDVFEVFDVNKQMILKKEHIAFHRVNWNAKSENLIQLAQEINIGLDSFIFIDDSPVECAEVRNNAPAVLTIQLPENGFNIKQLQNSWVFDKLRITEEDRKRSEKYKEEAVRTSFRSSVNSYKDFISGLNLKIEITTFQEENIPRISQLTYRTNQFNFTTIRRSESEIKNISVDKNFECYQVSLSDRFGEYGLIGVVIIDKSVGYDVDTFLLSCRVLGKGVEHLIISFLGEKAILSKSGFLSLHFRETEKNTPAGDFLLSNFEDIRVTDNDIQTFEIPVDRAAEFIFNPESQALNQEEKELSEKKEVQGNFYGTDKNSLYYLILDRYHSLENLVADLNKRITVKVDTVSGIGSGPTEMNVLSVWQKVLKSEAFGNSDNFFDIGGHSVLIPQIVIRLQKLFNYGINIVDVFQYPTVHDLAGFIEGKGKPEVFKSEALKNYENEGLSGKDIAVIGMAGRFSGVSNIEEYWDTISSGAENISFYTKEELIQRGVDKDLIENKDYVLANGNIDSADKFDSVFFGITPREADFMDPQHRVFLETCYEGLENAGYTAEQFTGEIGVFAGCGMNNYLLKNLFQHPGSLRSLGEFQTIINNNSDYLTTRVSYKLNLTGPSIDVQSACSTSLVAIHIACQNLIAGSCDIALAGGVFIQIPHSEGYMFESGGIFSPDGHCRPFDSEADGTLFGEGSGVVVLKRLDEAIRDNDTISAVIKGSAMNNDGSGKVGYMAPSVRGQVAVVNKAIADANISPDTISYIETHGTGTKLGDPVEVKALSQVFRILPDKKAHCALGSVKANIGHLDAAAGVAGVMKLVMMLKNKKMPPQLNYKSPNPELHLEDTPFYINTTLTDWPAVNGPRRAGISSFGIGGTNAHCILEEYVDPIRSRSTEKFHLLPISTKTSEALIKLTQTITLHVLNSGQDIADISYTLQHGRNNYRHRSLLVYKRATVNEDPSLVTDSGVNGIQELFDPSVVFMFTGQGSQYAGMAEDLYYEFSTFREIVDTAGAYLKKNFHLDILKYILDGTDDSFQEEINQTSIAQPLLFTIQYALARLLGEFGIRPDALIGHSIGEYAAAAISGVFDFEDALKLVAWRGKLMQEQKPGAMISVQLPYKDLLPFISEKVNLSLKNAPDMNVLSGDIQDITEVYDKLASDYPDIHLSKLKTSHAFHSYMMEPVIDPFRQILETVKFMDCKMPVVSNKSGSWAGKGELSAAGYWTDQIVSTVNFVDGVQELMKQGNTCLIEVGPGNTLATLLSQFDSTGKKISILTTLRHPKKKLNDVSVFLNAVSSAWISGVNIDWNNYYQTDKRFRVPLPAYPFERARHWVDPEIPFNYFSESNAGIKVSDSDSVKIVVGRPDEIKSSPNFHPRPEMENKYLAPVSDMEKELVKIWEDLLGIKGIGMEDDFFYLGGHSLLASQVINRISEKFHIRLPLETLFSIPTIKGLVAKIESTLPTANREPEKVTLDPDGMLPVSFDQKRLWIINQIDRNNPAYNIPFTYRLKGKLDNELFVKSLNILFQRQSILRSSIRSIEGEPYCIIHKYESIPVSFPDFSAYSPEMLEPEIQKFFSHESREPFDIEEGPLFRIYLAKINDTETIFHMTVQHMVFDGWSWGIFAGELRQIYNDLLVNSGITHEPLKYQYYDLANWQEKTIDKADLNNLVDYWKAQLKDSPSEINFPYDRRRKKTQSGLGRRQPIKFSAELSNKLKSLGQSENATVFMTLLSAFGLLLNKYSGDNDICIGAPTANRDDLNLEGIIGLFVNTIVLRLRFNDKQSFRDLLRITRETTMEALTHKDMPFEKLVDLLQPDRKTNINPIAQILFAYQNTPRPPLSLKGIEPERVLIKETISPFDMTFYAWEENGIIEGELEYNSEILEPDTITRIAENFENLLNQIIKEPDVPASGISLLSENEIRRIKSFRGVTTEYPKDKTLVQLFQEQAQLYPDKKAVIYNKVKYTYRELDERSDKLAKTLIEMGVISNAPVGILTDKSAEMIVGILAILKAGGGYVPIDPEYPQQRIDFMIDDSECKVILVQDKYMNIPVMGVKRVSLDSPDSYISGKHSAIGPGSSSDLAYIMYTSGTTGQPKGSLILQYSVVRLVRDTNYIELTSSDRILLTGAIVFDAITFEIWGALLNGASLYIVDKETILDAGAIGEELSQNKITVLWLTSPLFTQLADRRTDIFSGLKYLLVGGDVLSATHINMVRKNNPGLKLINGYGPTENTTFSTTFLIDKDYETGIPIGKPVSNSTAYIFDQGLKYQPIGVIGELFVGGDGVAKGYLKRDELNKKSFIPNPHRKGEIIYRTGDNARWLPDGNIEFHGRRDNQLKIRGFRVEVEEIESVISETDGVIETVVKPFQVEDNDKRLAAFLNVKESFRLNSRELRNILKEKLPVYMIPSNFTFMHGFPRTINGKTDKHALRVEINNMPVADRKETEKLTKTEKALLLIWNDCLRVEGITIDDNFFDLGGNSLLAISLFSKIESAFNIKLDLRTFFDSPRIREIGEIIDIKTQRHNETKPARRVRIYSKIIKGEI